MLEHTFVHIPGIGPKTEQRLWEQGILTWQHYLAAEQKCFSSGRDVLVREVLEESLQNRNNILFFNDRLTTAHHWRLFGAFEDRAVYLDIETNGGHHGVDEITVIGLYDGSQVQTYVSGLNMDEFETAISAYELVVTFNGSLFDLPVIRRHFPSISLPCGHIDLRFLMKKLGYRGGLKAIERQFSLHRGSAIEGITGYDAVNLWKDYQWGDESALERLIEYNTADIVNLKPLMQMGYRRLKEELLYSNAIAPHEMTLRF